MRYAMPRPGSLPATKLLIDRHVGAAIEASGRHALTVTLSLTLMVSAVSCSKAPDVEALLAQAKDQHAAGDLQSAVLTLRRAASQRPNDPEILLLMAEAYLDFERGDLAMVTLDQATKLGIPSSRVLPLRADALLLQGEFVEVLDLSPPDDTSSTVRIALLQRQAEARRALLARNEMGEAAVTRAYLELFRLLDAPDDTPELSDIETALHDARRKDANIERAWQHVTV